MNDDNGPVAGATVRVQASDIETLTDDAGRFTLTGLAEGVPITISAWKALYYCAKVEGIIPSTENVTLTLRLYQTTDNSKLCLDSARR